MDNEKLNSCELCRQEAALRLSHVVPKFVWRYLKASAPGALRTHRNVNLRVQDGPKDYLLCDRCEQRLSAWEGAFAEKLFVPLQAPEPVIHPIEYADWALKFAVSLSWRVLVFFLRQGTPCNFSPNQLILCSRAEETWRRFLLGHEYSPGKFEQHLLPVDILADYSGGEISPYLNRYMSRAVHVDLIATETSAMVYTKICRLIVFGRIEEQNRGQWANTQIRLRKGVVRPCTYRVPAGVAEYWNSKADEVKLAMDNTMSERQQARVQEMIAKNMDAISESEAYRAMVADVAFSGQRAFRSPSEPVDDEEAR